MKTKILLRVSTNHQETEAQKSAINEYIQKNKIKVSKNDWIEEKDVSGFKIPIEEREGLNTIKQMAINGEIDRLIVFNLDRIGRQTEALPYISFLNQLGVKIISVTEGEIDGFNINNQLLTYIKLWQSQNESIKTGLRVKAGKQAKNEHGGFNGGTPAFGYSYDKLNKKLVINEEEAEIVRIIFKEYINNGVTLICRFLKDNNIKLRGNSNWHPSTVSAILQNPIYIGRQQYGYYANNSKNRENLKTQPYDSSLRIVTDEMFYKAQEIKESRSTTLGSINRDISKSDALLSGFIYHKCEDGKERKMYIDYCYRKLYNKKDLMYKCTHCKKVGAKIQKTFGGKTLEREVEGKVLDIINNINPAEIEKLINENKSNNLESLNNKLDTLDKDLERQIKLKDKATSELEKVFLGESNVDIEIVNKMVSNAKDRIEELQKEISNTKIELKEVEVKENKGKNILNNFANFKEIYYKVSVKDKKKILSEIVEKVVVDENKKIAIYLNLL